MGQGVEREKYPESRGIETQKEAVGDVGKQESRSLHGYGPIAGNADLLAALTRKLETENRLDLTGQDILVTGGANQAFALLALALCDPGDRAVLFAPYYFSHLVALQIAQAEVVKGRWDPATWLPDVEHLRSLLAASPVKMVVLTTPGNPTGAVCPESLLKEVAALCRKAGAWLVVDESYEHFLHEGARHVSLCASALDFSGLVHVYSFSKSYGMAGWRLGYLVYPRGLKTALRSLQDTIPTHAAMVSQAVGLAALGAGREWVQRQVAGLTDCRERLWAVLSKHCPGSVRTEGAFYFLAQLPPHVSEAEAVHRLATEYRVLCTPGEAFGAPGTLRLSYGSLPPAECIDALGRLDAGLAALIKEGTDKVSKKKSSILV
ncbi:hypothetical protein NSK_007405 [Nannochloropsis salina CCMP1776]|uniref:Aminotransferase class I/classII large domain-containing protein n=1 Tax=Nannochloropsis salina CCMP1776 TaxID=1027361 RepID=A0A4D9CSE6_9STRA|nr:hypothetical protein NSK_007405 [Nannochloropsis salina CCMP1776]|eukprot:TFJ81444.1 hypothetical protein NSK_007405 [Nannochloropsis salina CCMP1776]